MLKFISRSRQLNYTRKSLSTQNFQILSFVKNYSIKNIIYFHCKNFILNIWVSCYPKKITSFFEPCHILREKCPNTEFFLVRIFPHSDWIRRDTPYLSVLSPNAGKYAPEKTPYLDTFHAVILVHFRLTNNRYCTVISVKLLQKFNVLKSKLWIFAKVYLAKLFLISISGKFINVKFLIYTTWQFAEDCPLET